MRTVCVRTSTQLCCTTSGRTELHTVRQVAYNAYGNTRPLQFNIQVFGHIRMYCKLSGSAKPWKLGRPLDLLSVRAALSSSQSNFRPTVQLPVGQATRC